MLSNALSEGHLGNIINIEKYFIFQIDKAVSQIAGKAAKS